MARLRKKEIHKKCCVTNCIGKRPVGTRQADRNVKLLGIFMERGCLGRSKIVVVECLV
jgi:hypothetical protein